MPVSSRFPEGFRDQLKKLRKYANYHDWPNKITKEIGVVMNLCESMERAGEAPYTKLAPIKNDPPDVSARDPQGRAVGIEVTELVSEKAVRKNEQGASVYRDWDPPEVIAEISRILKQKDAKQYKGGLYSSIALVIHTDEPTIGPDEYIPILKECAFDKPRQLETAFFIFSYWPDPHVRRCPYMRLNISGRRKL